jgi:hypothetical protein
MEVRNHNQNGVEFIVNIFGHRGSLFNNNDGKNKIDQTTQGERYF